MRKLAVLFVLLLWAVPAHGAITLCGTGQTAYNFAVGASLSVNTASGCSSSSTTTIAFIFGEYYNGTATLGTPVATGGTGCGSVTGISINPVVAGLTDSYLWYQVCTGGLPTSYSVSPTSTGGALSLASWAFQGFNSSTPIDGTPTSTNSTTAAASISAPSQTTSVSGDTIINNYICAGSAQDVGTGASFTYSSGTEIVRLSRTVTSANGIGGFAYWSQGSAGASGSQTFSWTGGNNVGTTNIPLVGITVALQPAAATGIQYVNGSFSGNSGTLSNITISRPSGVTNNTDLEIICGWAYNGNVSSCSSNTPTLSISPGTWTLVDSQHCDTNTGVASTSEVFTCFWHIPQSGETTYTIAVASSSNDINATLQDYSGANTSTPIDNATFDTASPTGSGTATYLSVITSHSSDMLATSVVDSTNPNLPGNPSGFTAASGASGINAGSSAQNSAYKIQAATGSTGNFTSTVSGTDAWFTELMAIAPASAGGGGGQKAWVFGQ